MKSVTTFVKANRMPIAIIGVLGSIAGFFFSLLDLDSALKAKKVKKS